MAIALVFAINAMTPGESNQLTSVPVSLSIEQDSSLNNASQLPPIDTGAAWNEVTIQSGDSLSTIFQRVGLTAAELQQIMNLGHGVAGLARIMPGQSIQFQVDEQGYLTQLKYEATPLKKLVIIKKSHRGFEAEWKLRKPEVLISYKTARITKANPSLYQAGQAAGLSDKMIMKLSYIFQWDISFALELRQGDSFTLIYEDIYIDGEKVKEGDILATQFNNLGKTYTAVLYEDGASRKDYFTPDGRSMRKTFLRDPVHFSHVSSSFNLKRFHPIHKRVMPHRGIDYAANRGTPVSASGDGKVVIARSNSTSGRYVVIKHGEQYTTKYLHLSSFAKGIRMGKSVKQGQTIGYVGATGWATAPHLHYEFLVDGSHRNPRTVKLPKAEPINPAHMSQFLQTTRPVLARLESLVGATSYAFASEAEIR